jgi:hypothetical protein
MAVKVILPTISNSSRSVNIVTSNSRQTTATTLGQLQGVDITGVEDGYALVYNAASGKFEATAPLEGVGNIDGGSY